jgi:hypothetical protein
MRERYEDVLTPEALGLLGVLHREFAPFTELALSEEIRRISHPPRLRIDALIFVSLRSQPAR